MKIILKSFACASELCQVQNSLHDIVNVMRSSHAVVLSLNSWEKKILTLDEIVLIKCNNSSGKFLGMQNISAENLVGKSQKSNDDFNEHRTCPWWKLLKFMGYKFIWSLINSLDCVLASPRCCSVAVWNSVMNFYDCLKTFNFSKTLLQHV